MSQNLKRNCRSDREILIFKMGHTGYGKNREFYADGKMYVNMP
jgi:hypothetical protein